MSANTTIPSVRVFPDGSAVRREDDLWTIDTAKGCGGQFALLARDGYDPFDEVGDGVAYVPTCGGWLSMGRRSTTWFVSTRHMPRTGRLSRLVYLVSQGQQAVSVAGAVGEPLHVRSSWDRVQYKNHSQQDESWVTDGKQSMLADPKEEFNDYGILTSVSNELVITDATYAFMVYKQGGRWDTTYARLARLHLWPGVDLDRVAEVIKAEFCLDL